MWYSIWDRVDAEVLVGLTSCCGDTVGMELENVNGNPGRTLGASVMTVKKATRFFSQDRKALVQKKDPMKHTKSQLSAKG
jgi:hypothetical protein